MMQTRADTPHILIVEDDAKAKMRVTALHPRQMVRARYSCSKKTILMLY